MKTPPSTPVREITFKKADVGPGVTSKTEHEPPPRKDGYSDYDSRFVTRVHATPDDAAAHLVQSMGGGKKPGKKAGAGKTASKSGAAASAISSKMLSQGQGDNGAC